MLAVPKKRSYNGQVNNAFSRSGCDMDIACKHVSDHRLPLPHEVLHQSRQIISVGRLADTACLRKYCSRPSLRVSLITFGDLCAAICDR